MWLLDTEHYGLRHFDHPPSRYAIMSHVWNHNHSSSESEQTFQDLRAFRSPRSVSSKIRECCKHARVQHIQWVWIDSCCVDHTNSVELSESINSMFAWYAGAAVCYAYLSDVDPDENPAARNSSFRNSKWHRRSWTLLELLAPRSMVFFARDWHTIGTKDFLVDLLAEVTEVPVDVLTAKKPVVEVPVAVRMSWAAKRRAQLVEDEAYSLFGLFNVNMPAIYGEKHRAFRRLQEEIMKTSGDLTLFTWGPCVSLPPAPKVSEDSTQSHESSSAASADAVTPLTSQTYLCTPVNEAGPPFGHVEELKPASEKPLKTLLAPSVYDFETSLLLARLFKSTPQIVNEKEMKSFGIQGDKKPSTSMKPTFTLAAGGISARLPLIEIPGDKLDTTLSPVTNQYLAVLSFVRNDSQMPTNARSTTTFICLALSRATSGSDIYDVGATVKGEGFARVFLVDFSDPSTRSFFNLVSGSHFSYHWKTITISQPADNHAANSQVPAHPSPPYNERPGAQCIVIPRWNLKSLDAEGLKAIHPENPTFPKTVSPTAGQMFVFSHQARREEIRVHAGWCAHDRGLWFAVEFVDPSEHGGAVLLGRVHDAADFVPSDAAPRSSRKTAEKKYGVAQAQLPGIPVARCDMTHVRGWDAALPRARTPTPSAAKTDDASAGLRWARFRKFAWGGRTVTIRVVDAGAEGEESQRAPARKHSQMWVVGIEVDFADKLESIPPRAGDQIGAKKRGRLSRLFKKPSSSPRAQSASGTLESGRESELP